MSGVCPGLKAFISEFSLPTGKFQNIKAIKRLYANITQTHAKDFIQLINYQGTKKVGKQTGAAVAEHKFRRAARRETQKTEQ